MTNLDIETFFAVLQHGTLTAAAEALYITQPTLTARIQTLEAEVGAELFHRGKGQRRIRLTEAGERFLPLARRWQNLMTETQSLSEAARREYLHILAVHTSNQYILPPVYQKFLERRLSASLWVETLRSYEAISAIARAEANLALVDSDLRYDQQIQIEPLFREEFYLLGPAEGRYPDVVEPTALDFTNEILISGQQEIRAWHDHWFGVNARPLLYTDVPQNAEHLPFCGVRWAIMPAATAQHFHRLYGNQICRLSDPPESRTFYLITPKGAPLSEAAQLFLTDLREHLRHIEGVQMLS